MFQRSIMPSSTISLPPPPPSSAGWKITATVPSKLRVSARYFRGPQQHGGVPVMAAGMHRSGGLGGVVDPRFLVDRQRVHVGAQADGAARGVRLPLDDAHDAGAPDAGDDLVTAEFAQLLGHERAGAVGVEQDLGVFVDVAAPLGDLGQQLGETVLDGHWSLSLSVSPAFRRRSTISAKKAHAVGHRLVVEDVFRVVAHGAVPVAEEDIGAGAFLQHVAEILRRHDRVDIVGDCIGHGAGGLDGMGRTLAVVDRHRVAGMPDHFRLRTIGCRRVGGDLADAGLHDRAVFGVEGAHGALHPGHIGDDVRGVRVGLERAHGQHHAAQRIDVARHDGMERDHDMGGHERGIHRLCAARRHGRPCPARRSRTRPNWPEAVRAA